LTVPDERANDRSMADAPAAWTAPLIKRTALKLSSFSLALVLSGALAMSATAYAQDADCDRVADASDNCPVVPNPDTRTDDADDDACNACSETGPADPVDRAGCSIDQLCPRELDEDGNPWKNHGKYVGGMKDQVKRFRSKDVIDATQGSLVTEAAKASECGEREPACEWPHQSHGRRFRIPAAFVKSGWMTAGSASAKTRKIAAALAAVELYLQEEQAAAAEAAAKAAAPPNSGLSPWALSGRFAAIGSRMGSRGSRHSR
jgi:hypothetical protein